MDTVPTGSLQQSGVWSGAADPSFYSCSFKVIVVCCGEARLKPHDSSLEW